MSFPGTSSGPSNPSTDTNSTGTGTAPSSGASDTQSGGDPATTTTTTGTAGAGSDGVRFDVGSETQGGTGGSGDVCTVSPDNPDAVPPCGDEAPADSFDPVIEWTQFPEEGVNITPLVANLTDDNGDGRIDLCDTPDIVAQDHVEYRLAILDGATRMIHHSIDLSGRLVRYPAALGDIDADGIPEFVVLSYVPARGDPELLAYEHDGSPKWGVPTRTDKGPVSLADLDADRDVEILTGKCVHDHLGTELWCNDAAIMSWSHLAVDLDGDDDLEVLMGASAHQHDGTLLFSHDDLFGAEADAWRRYGGPMVADFDLDGDPEVVILAPDRTLIVAHDGTILAGPSRLSGIWTTDAVTMRPGTVDDYNGNGQPEIGQVIARYAGRSEYAVYGADLMVRWSTAVQDGTGAASATAFDFLGDGTSEAVLIDEEQLVVMDGESGSVVMSQPRLSLTGIEYPIVADVDNDGSAEIVVPSSWGAPGLQVFGDADDRWVPARRIWNQSNYHITNVREDGTIPRVQPKNWKSYNNFRVQAQLGAGGPCVPPEPEG